MLIDLTIDLVDLIYWQPVIRPDTPAADILGSVEAPEPTSESSDVKMDYADDENEAEFPTPRAQQYGAIRRPGAGATLEERRDYGQYLLSGRGSFVPLRAHSRSDHLMLDLPFDADDGRLLKELAQADLESKRFTITQTHTWIIS
jgi:hypothetical protein